MNGRPIDGSDRLDSWKAIASYLNRDVRTVRRWEALGLPVHRVSGAPGKSVFAFTGEIDAWLTHSTAERNASASAVTSATAAHPPIGLLVVVAGLASLALASTAYQLAGGRAWLAHATSIAPEPRATRLWSGPELTFTTSIASDGRQAFYVDWTTGDLATIDPRSQVRRRLTHSGTWFHPYGHHAMATNLVVSPDGTQVAFAWRKGNDPGDLRIARTDGSDTRVLYADRGVRFVSPYEWSRDGQSILAYVMATDGARRVDLISTVDGSTLFTLPVTTPPLRATMSPDGRYLAYDTPAGTASAQHDIVIMSVDHVRQTTVLRNTADDIAPVWSADGRDIYFLSDRATRGALYAQSVADGRAIGLPRLVKDDMTRAWPLGIDRDGAFEYAVIDTISDVTVVAYDAIRGRVVGQPVVAGAPAGRTASGPSWAPDGRRLVFIAGQPFDSHKLFNKPYRFGLKVRDVDTGAERDVPADFDAFARPRWSPDGRTFLLIGSGPRHPPRLYQVDATTGLASEVTGLATNDIRELQWTRDGDSFLYKTWAGPVLLHSLRTGANQTISAPVDDNAALSPDGRSLAYTTHDEVTGTVKLMVSRVPNGDRREIARMQLPEWIHAIAWTPRGELIISKGNRATFRSDLYRVVVGTGRITPIGISTSDVWSIAVSPDGTHLAYHVVRTDGEIWKLSSGLRAGR